jgi:hypothetical protein
MQSDPGRVHVLTLIYIPDGLYLPPFCCACRFFFSTHIILFHLQLWVQRRRTDLTSSGYGTGYVILHYIVAYCPVNASALSVFNA